VLSLALTPRWIGYLSLTVAFAVVASFFGVWQWDRREQAVAAIAKVDANYDQTPLPLEPFLSTNIGFSSDQEWLPVVVSGVYQPEDQVLVRTRPRGGQVGFEVLVPLQIAPNVSVVVNRGWVPTGETSDFPDEIPPPPPGEVTVVGRLKPAEPQLQGRGAPEGQLSSIDLATYQEQLAGTIETSFYLQRVSETPPANRIPVQSIKPVPNEGPHLSYTLQWFVFAGLAFIAYFWLLRSEHRNLQGLPPTVRRKKTDAQEEDALLE
jgi:cytochrome oxidase assembly protein ShyY1